jgi:adenylosuccinate synthase
MTTTTYTDYPFTAQGINFVSRVYSNSPFLKTIQQLPTGIFEQMNQQAVSEMIGDPSLLSTSELLDELEKLNEGGSHAFILLGANA